MKHSVVPVGSLVRVTSYGPFRELRGTIQEVNSIGGDWENPVRFYLIAPSRGSDSDANLVGTPRGRVDWFSCYDASIAN